jgi:hypothetical protein
MRCLGKKTIFAVLLLLPWCFSGCAPFAEFKKGGLIVIIPPAGSSFSFNVEIYYNYEIIGRYSVAANRLKICSVDLDGDYQIFYHAAPGRPTKLLAKIKIKGGESVEVKIPLPTPP